MARKTPGNYVPLDVNYPRDRAIRAAGPDAELLFVRSMAYSKGSKTDGFVPDYDLEVVAIGLRNVKRSVGKLVEHGLWLTVDGGWRIRSWLRWNQPTAEEEAFHAGQAQHSVQGNHKRWHTERGVVDPDCILCGTPLPDRVPDPLPESGTHRVPESPLREGKGREGKKPSCASADAEREFDEFWLAYPRRKAKADALKAFKAARKTVDLSVILDGIRRAMASDWRGKDPEFVPYPATWLRRQGWADEPDQPQPTQVRHLPHASELERPPDGLSPSEYAAWERDRRQRRRA